MSKLRCVLSVEKVRSREDDSRHITASSLDIRGKEISREDFQTVHPVT